MSSTPPPRPDAGGPAPQRTPRLFWLAGRVQRSMALQIALGICGVTLLLILAGSWMVSLLIPEHLDGLEPLLVPIDGLACIRPETLQARRAHYAAGTWSIVVSTLIAGALAAGLFAWWITRRVLLAAERLATTAHRISGQTLHDRLEPGRSPTELEPVAEAFNQMLDRLQDAFTRLSGFSSDVAHDLRVPIHSLLTTTQVTLARPRSADEYRAALEATVPVYERMSRLIDNILFLARTDQGQPLLHAGPIALQDKLTSAADFFGILAEERGLELVLRMPGPMQLWADDILVTRMVANLVTNAVRHARDGSTIVLSAAAAADGGCEIAVANDGDPIPPEQQARIFERRYRGAGDRSKDPARSGLGLAIVQSAMALHGGSVRVDSGPGRPTVFTLVFPPPPADGGP
jgi:two-component system heavy metal sensor histidine kinase CusS